MVKKRKRNQLAYIPTNDLQKAFEIIGFADERVRKIIHDRVERSRTLREIGQDFGITRERVRQIQSRVVENFLKYLSLFEPFLKALELSLTKRAAKEVIDEGSGGSRDVFERWMVKQLQKKGFLASRRLASELVTLIRLVVKSTKGKKLVKEFPNLTYVMCKYSPIILEHSEVQREEKEKREKERRLTYRELGILVLGKAGQPLHWREIAERAEKLNRREEFDPRGIYNALQSHKDLFVLTGQGTYGLVEWSQERATPYTEIIAEVLLEVGQNLPLDTIYYRVHAKRPAKKVTIQMYLETHPRFYKAINGTYGLRAWLPPREEQTLRTPEWLIEDSQSFKRVHRALERGYKVEAIIQRDRERLKFGHQS